MQSFWPASFCVGHVNDTLVKPSEKVETLLAVEQPRVFGNDNWMVEDALAPVEVEAVAQEIRLALVLVPGDHAPTLGASSVESQVFCSYQKRIPYACADRSTKYLSGDASNFALHPPQQK